MAKKMLFAIVIKYYLKKKYFIYNRAEPFM